MSEINSGAVMGKVTRRLIPFLFLLYIVNILDRINVGFASLRMLADLGMSEQAYGLGAGLFYIGYFIFEVPSNLILSRMGARRWIARILISWGLISCAMAMVQGKWGFYGLRLLLGFAEAGFFPGIILYLTYWFPARQRAREVSCFMIGSPVAGIISGPVSGAILEHMHQLGGLASWQWLFLIEGAPAVLLGVIALCYLTDRPEQANWLKPEERDWLVRRMAGEELERGRRHGADLLRALREPRLWLLILLYFTLAAGTNTMGFYLPKLIRGRFPGSSDQTVGLLSMIPSACAIVAMILVGSHSDRTGERRWHVAMPAFVAAAGWVVAAWSPTPEGALAALSVTMAAMLSTLAPYWSLPTAFLSGTAAAGGIAFINSLGNLGGFAGPYLLGSTHQWTGSFEIGMTVLGSVLFLGGLLALSVRHEPAPEPEQIPEAAMTEPAPVATVEAIRSAE